MRALLVTDDHEPVLHTLAYVFGLHGYRVLTANSGSRALVLAQAETIDAALIDAHMPVMDGFQTASELLTRMQAAGRRVPVWLMTGAFSAGAQRRAAEIGVVALLGKPFNCEEFVASLEREWAAPAAPAVPESRAEVRPEPGGRPT